MAKIIENAAGPITAAGPGRDVEQNVQAPCGHMRTITVFMHNNAIPDTERPRIDEQLAEPCEQCKKEKKHVRLS